MAFPDLLPVTARRCGGGTLGFRFNVEASLEAVVSVREVVGFDDEDDDEHNSNMTMEVEVGDDGWERDDRDAGSTPRVLGNGIVKYELEYQPRRAQATKTDAKMAEISSEDSRHVGSHSYHYQITPRQNGFRNYMPRSDQITARLHPVEQQQPRSRPTATPTPTRQEEEQPIGKTRPPVLSGLGRSSPLRNSWTINDV
jgi:hypothetical protein